MDDVLPGGRARLSQERSRIRREHLVHAAARLFAGGGTKAITHRSVSEAAEVPLATVSYYFASIDQLVDVMFADTMSAWAERCRHLPLLEGEMTPDDVGEVFVELVRSTPAERYTGELQVYLAALARPQLAEDVQAMQGVVFESVLGVVQAAGITEPERVVPPLVMLLTGALVATTAPDNPADRVTGFLRHQVVRIVQDALAQQA